MKPIRFLCLLVLLAFPGFSQTNSPAYEAAKHFRRGASFGNFLENRPGGWSLPHTVEDLKIMRSEGFDHVRLPICWHQYAGPAPEYKLSDTIFAKVDDLVTNATALGLAVILDFHAFDAFTSDPAANADKFYAVWRQVAAHYANAPAEVAFELLNEPRDAAKTTVMNPIYAEAIRQIRMTNPRRTLFAGPGQYNSVNELANLQLPEGDRNIIVTVHCYEPFHFTHQGASWAGPDVKVTGIVFPGPPKQPLVVVTNLSLTPWTRDWIERYNALPAEKNPCSALAFLPLIEKARAWSEREGRPVHFGEFGCFTKADPESRARFYGAMRRALEQAGMGWAVWDWKSNFRYWDERTKQPATGMRQALFGQ